MAVEAPLSKFNRNNIKLYLAFCVIVSLVLAYDGYLSKYEWSKRHDFYEKHFKDGKADGTLMFNRIVPIFGAAGAIYFAIQWSRAKNRKVTADEESLIVEGKTIPIDSIQAVDRTHFEKKGFFTLTYRSEQGSKTLRLSDKTYDNLGAVLEHIVAKIS